MEISTKVQEVRAVFVAMRYTNTRLIYLLYTNSLDWVSNTFSVNC